MYKIINWKVEWDKTMIHINSIFFSFWGSRWRDSISALPAPSPGRRLESQQVRMSELVWHALCVNCHVFGEKTFSQSVHWLPHSISCLSRRMSLQRLLSSYNHGVKALLNSEVSRRAEFENVACCFNSLFFPSTLLQQSVTSVAAVTDTVCAVRNLLCGLSPQQLDDAIGALNRVNPLALVGHH